MVEPTYEDVKGDVTEFLKRMKLYCSYLRDSRLDYTRWLLEEVSMKKLSNEDLEQLMKEYDKEAKDEKL